MDTNQQGNIGESIALSHFLSEGYEVYLPFGTASKCDMIIVKDNLTKRVSVKTCGSKPTKGKYVVKIRQGKMNKQVPFDASSSDILFIYIVESNKIHIFESKNITQRFEIRIDP